MEELMNVSDIIVARSGAMTITEISNLGKPSILIPLPNVSGDHQLHNAKVLENVGAARIILNDKLNGVILNDTIQEIVLDKEKMQKMGKMAQTKAVYEVEDKIYSEIKKAIEK
jgi:UDP-N-acetylglucosamine--N-acetylmuramyl-(pentapeptide) pyrophosphoryl-undecaprenol N-acetylglucosamine transferase